MSKAVCNHLTGPLDYWTTGLTFDPTVTFKNLLAAIEFSIPELKFLPHCQVNALCKVSSYTWNVGLGRKA